VVKKESKMKTKPEREFLSVELSFLSFFFSLVLLFIIAHP